MNTTRDELRHLLKDGAYIHPDHLITLLDQLDQAEARIRDLTQEVRDERGAALDQIEQVKIRDARIKAVQDVVDQHSHYGLVEADDIRRALDA